MRELLLFELNQIQGGLIRFMSNYVGADFWIDLNSQNDAIIFKGFLFTMEGCFFNESLVSYAALDNGDLINATYYSGFAIRRRELSERTEYFLYQD